MLGLGISLAFSGACKKSKPKPTQASEQEGLTSRSLLRAGVLNPSTDAYNAEFNKSVLKTLSVFKWKGVSGSYNNNGKAGLFGTFSLLMPDISGNDGNNITFINPNSHWRGPNISNKTVEACYIKLTLCILQDYLSDLFCIGHFFIQVCKTMYKVSVGRLCPTCLNGGWCNCPVSLVCSGDKG